MLHEKLSLFLHATSLSGACGGTVVEALCYKPEGRGIDSRWCHWNFSFIIIFPATLWPWCQLSL
jgi:hypothetical protein